MTTARRIPHRPRRGAGLLAGLALLLSGCMVPGLPLPLGPAPELGAEDVITVRSPSGGMAGFFGESSISIGPKTITSRYTVPEDAVVYTVTRDLEPAERETAVEAVEDYLAWERRLSEDERVPCTDIPSTTVEVTGMTEHSSTVQDCHEETPLRALLLTARGMQDERVADLARPSDTWRFEIGDREAYTTETTLADGLALRQEGAASRDLGWDGTAALLAPINVLLLDGAAAGSCPEASEELALTRETSPTITLRFPLCPTGPTAEVAEVLRGG
ncbi:hypothetical protein [Brachybacterium hainanense]|uniref:Lipoprotein n=1 Tax=Brachybacterium hainanense TaxID=1541174 RepID=A0ABV6R6B4_9MICO